jgi:LuxR family transcriptional regulator, maltose regulon positive regulatory protein
VVTATPRGVWLKPAFLQFVLSSRLDPPLSLPRLRLQGRLRDLRAAQLGQNLPDPIRIDGFDARSHG